MIKSKKRSVVLPVNIIGSSSFYIGPIIKRLTENKYNKICLLFDAIKTFEYMGTTNNFKIIDSTHYINVEKVCYLLLI